MGFLSRLATFSWAQQDSNALHRPFPPASNRNANRGNPAGSNEGGIPSNRRASATEVARQSPEANGTGEGVHESLRCNPG